MADVPKRGVHRFYVSRHHRHARDLLLERMRQIPVGPQQFNELAAACVALVSSCVSYLESHVNEFYSAALSFGLEFTTLTVCHRKRLQSLAEAFDWKQRPSLLEKYQIALAVLDLETFETGARPYQDAVLLIQLRNELIHYEPRSIEIQQLSGERISVPKLEDRLRAKIGECPYQGLRDFFPENCLHLKCAEWAVETSTRFTEEFARRTGWGAKEYISASLFE